MALSVHGLAARFTFVDDSGIMRSDEVLVIRAQDVLGRPIRAFPGAPFYIGVASDYGGYDSRYADLSGMTCVVVTAVPWAGVGNRPWYVSANILYESIMGKKLLSGFSIMILLCLCVGLAASIPVLWAGFFAEDDQDLRKTCMIKYGAFAVASLIVLVGVRSSSIGDPLEYQEKTREYYAAYDGMPKTPAGYLLPFYSAGRMSVFNSPPRAVEYEQTPGTFFEVLTVFVALGAALFGMPLYRGLYWFFAPLPLQLRFNRATARGEWPTADEIIEAVREGTLNKSAWQSKMMETKAKQFEGELQRRRQTLERRRQHGR